MDEKCTHLWTKLAAALKPQVSADTFKRWFSAVKLTSATADEVTLLVPNNIYQFWIESNHMPALQGAINSVLGGPRAVKFVCAVDTSAGSDAAEPEPNISPKKPDRCRTSRKHSGPESAQHIRVFRRRAEQSRSRTPPAWRSRSRRPRPTIRSSFTAGSASARRTSCRRSASTSRRAASTPG